MEIGVVLTTRGSYAKFKKIIELANPTVIVGGELVLVDRTVPFKVGADKILYFNVAGSTHLSMAKSIGNAVQEFSTAVQGLDAVMVVGDRFETLGAVIAAYTLGIPVIHLEGGEVSGALDDGYRWAISDLSRYHFPCSERAWMNLVSRGFENVFWVGSTSLDVILDADEDMNAVQESSGSGPVVDIEKEFLLVVFHPDTKNPDCVENQTKQLVSVIDDIRVPTIWLNANLDAGSGTIGHVLRQYRDERHPDFIHFFKGLPIEQYGTLLKKASCMIGNSSSGVREGSFLGLPNVIWGLRQKDREMGKNSIVSRGDLKGDILKQLKIGGYKPETIYGDGHASERIVNKLCTLL